MRFEGGVTGRVDDVLIVRGVNIFPSAVENLVRRFPEIGEFAVDVYRKEELDVMELRIEVTPVTPMPLPPLLPARSTPGSGCVRWRRRSRWGPSSLRPRARRFTDHRKDLQ